MPTDPQSFYTFKLNRKCLHCGTPIPDQNHASQKFCPRIKQQNGSIKSYKDDYHYPRKKMANEPFRKLAEYHKRVYAAIHYLYEKNKGKATLEELSKWNISLNRSMEYSNKNGIFIAYYHVYAIEHIGGNDFKIFKHGRNLF